MYGDRNMRLRPSEILYSQDSISKHFFDGNLIGETLDDLCEGRCSVGDIPVIHVALHNGSWVAADNRRLWVFKQLEELGKCDKIPVFEIANMSMDKLTRSGTGYHIRVRGSDPGGRWHKGPPGFDCWSVLKGILMVTVIIITVIIIVVGWFLAQ